MASFRFARHYSGNLGWFLFLALLRCFSSGGFPHIPILCSIWWLSFSQPDCSIRKSADRSVLTTPRSLSQLITSFFGSQCQGIRPALFLALPFVSCSEFSWIVNSILVVFYPIIFFIIVLTRSILICITFTLFDFQASFCSWEQISINNSLFTEIYFQFWWAQMDSNHRPHAYQACALTTWAMRPLWWRWGGSNSWPSACKADALPAELHPHIFISIFKTEQCFLSYFPADRSSWASLISP